MLRRLFCILLALAVAPTAAADAKSVFAKAAPSVVVVVAQDGGGEQTAQGSGVVVGEGVAVTNCHVIENAAKVSIRQAADSQAAETYLMNAEVVARDEDNDLCLLYAPDLSKPPAAKTAAMGNAKNLVIGEEVYAIGAPQGLELSLSRGIVAQLRGVKGKAPIVQTDAAISPGSSGGGLFNENGELVGVTTFKRKDGENLNFAMPVEGIVDLIQTALRAKKEHADLWDACMKNIKYQCVLALAKQATQQINDKARKNMGLSTDTTDVFESIGGLPSERERALQGIIAAQIQAGDFSGAKQAVRQINNVYWKNAGFGKVAAAQAKADDLAGAKQTIRQVEGDDSQATALTRVVIAKAEVGDLVTAKQIARQIYIASSRSQALRGIASVQVEIGDINDAKQTLADALHHAKQISSSYSKDWALRDIAIAQAKAGDVIVAKQTTAEIRKNYERDRALRGVAAAQSESGDINGAKQTAQQIRDANLRAEALQRIAVAQAQSGNTIEAKQTISDALNSVPPVEGDAVAFFVLSSVIATQAQVGDVVGAKQSVQKIDDARLRSPALRGIAIMQAKMGEINKAKQTAREIYGVDSYDGTLRDISAIQADAGDFSGAKQTAQPIESVGSRVGALRDIAVKQAKTGSINDAKQTFAIALDSARQIDDADTQAWAMWFVATGQAEAQDFAGAMLTAQLISDNSEKAQALAKIAEFLAKQ